MKVRELMSTPARTCGADATANDVAKLMWDHDIGAVPIVDAGGKLQGLITDRDVSMAAYTKGKKLAEIPATSAMSAPAFSCKVEDDIAKVVKQMRDYRTRRMPVIDENQVVLGVISLDDAAQSISRSKGTQSADFTLAVTQALATRSKRAA